MSILSDYQKSVVQDIMDEMLDDWSKPCKIWYRPIEENCNHSLDTVQSPFGGVASLHGGPAVFICPFCNGTGKREKEVTDTINLELDYTNKFNRNNWLNNDLSIKQPYELVNVKGYVTDLPKLQKAIEIQLDLPVFPHVSGRYILMGDADSSFAIIQGRYFLATLKRHS